MKAASNAAAGVRALQVVYVRDTQPGLGLLKGEGGTIVEMLDEP